jgi:hypothetical protein
MKKLLPLILLVFILESCSIFNRSPKTGCPGSGAAIGAERIASGDQKAIRAANKSKFKGGRKIY